MTFQGELTLQKFKARPEQSRRVQGSKFNAEEAEAYFQKAIAIAQKQEAKSWELRAATSLARLWQQQGKVAEARELLAPVYNWFTEGFDTADLKDAKTLLEQ
jgi:predicted ATPase